MSSRPNRGGAFEKWAVRLLLPMVSLALLVALAGITGFAIDWRAWFDGPERGTWRVSEIDGIDLRGERMWIEVRDGKVRGGRDGCNYWSNEGDADPRSGEGMMISTLAWCGQTPARRAYAALAHGSPEMALLSDNVLEMRVSGVTGRLVRWTEAMERAEQRALEATHAAQPSASLPGVYPLRNEIPPPPTLAFPPPPPPEPGG